MAVFTPVSEDQVQDFLRNYDVGELVSLKGITEGVENTNYRLETTRGSFALTLFESRTPHAALPFVLGLSDHLAGNGLPAPRVERTQSGEWIGDLANRPAAISEWMPGSAIRAILPSVALKGGVQLARLHAAGTTLGMLRRNDFGSICWRPTWERCRSASNGRFQDLIVDLEASIPALESAWPSSLPAGVIHGDYFPDNVLFDGGTISGVIDFGFACTDAYAYDLAIALNAWGFTTGGVPLPTCMGALLRGYRSARELSSEELNALGTLCQGAAMRFTLTRLHDLLIHEARWQVRPKNPRTFHRRLDFWRSYPNFLERLDPCFT